MITNSDIDAAKAMAAEAVTLASAAQTGMGDSCGILREILAVQLKMLALLDEIEKALAKGKRDKDD